MSRKNGGIIGPANTPVGGLFAGVAGGIWRMNDVANFVANNQWPKTPQNIENSCRFNAASSDSLTRTFGTPTNNKIWTYSFWMKHCDNAGVLLNTGADTSYMYFRGSSASPVPFGFSVEQYVGSFQYKLIPNEVFRDHSAWQHIVIAFDTTQGTASNRVKIYKNGVQITSFNSEDYPSQNLDTQVNSAVEHKIGGFASSGFYDGYLAEVVFIDGQQLDPTSFGETNTATGIWTPKKIGAISGAGNNSFYLDFKDSSNLGNDASGLNNDFTVNNLTSIDQSTDTCVENFATFNSIAYGESGAAATFANGNLDIIRGSASWRTAPATIGALNKGKWYYECKVGTILSSSPYRYIQVGVISEDAVFGCIDSYHDSTTYSYAYHWDGTKYVNNSASSFGSAITSGSTVMIALDFDNNYIYAGLDGTWQNSGDPTSGSSGTGALSALQSGQNWFPTVSVYNTTHQANFGNPPYSISSGNSDANGHGNFEYAVPSGYYALNTSNLNTYG